jgi:hypothetical protein
VPTNTALARRREQVASESVDGIRIHRNRAQTQAIELRREYDMFRLSLQF